MKTLQDWLTLPRHLGRNIDKKSKQNDNNNNNNNNNNKNNENNNINITDKNERTTGWRSLKLPPKKAVLSVSMKHL